MVPSRRNIEGSKREGEGCPFNPRKQPYLMQSNSFGEGGCSLAVPSLMEFAAALQNCTAATRCLGVHISPYPRLPHIQGQGGLTRPESSCKFLAQGRQLRPTGSHPSVHRAGNKGVVAFANHKLIGLTPLEKMERSHSVY